jgi:hypothetical protein
MHFRPKLVIQLLLTVVPMLLGCSSAVHVWQKPGTSFGLGSTVTVMVEGEDRLGAAAMLEGLLGQRGFNVISASVAQQTLELRQDVAKTVDGETASSTLGRVITVSADYVIRVQYTVRSGVSFGRFSASVIEVSSGQVTATSSFESMSNVDRGTASVLTEFVSRLGGGTAVGAHAQRSTPRPAKSSVYITREGLSGSASVPTFRVGGPPPEARMRFGMDTSPSVAVQTIWLDTSTGEHIRESSLTVVWSTPGHPRSEIRSDKASHVDVVPDWRSLPGSYRIDLYIDRELVDAAEFTIVE